MLKKLWLHRSCRNTKSLFGKYLLLRPAAGLLHFVLGFRSARQPLQGCLRAHQPSVLVEKPLALARHEHTFQTDSNKKGFTLVEIIFAVALGGTLVLALGAAVLKSGMLNKKKVNEKAEREFDMSRLVHHIVKVGRYAENCTASLTKLTCNVKLSAADGAPIVPVEFERVGNEAPYQIEYREKRGAAPEVKQTLTLIEDFVICSDFNWATCPMKPASSTLNAQALWLMGDNASPPHRPPPPPDPLGLLPPVVPLPARVDMKNRYFRFLIVPYKQVGRMESLDTYRYQSGFFVRHPISASHYPDVAYQWGSIR